MTYLYNYGDKCTNISGGFSETGTGTRSLSFNANNMKTTASSSSGIVIFTNKAVNLSGYKFIHMLSTIKVTSEFSVFGIKNTIPNGWDAPTIGTKITTSSLTDKVEITFDVTDYNGEYYICFSQQSNQYANIYAIWIE